ncbi:phosphoribosylanthranilate isomerase [Myxococcus sp. CA051A]|uniref:phosphoribosylanthranilate isomerase n=1 Tax=unclassified Myxococcus TaxID=2648731 RepID=UPI00157B70F7|nr:phosphoribosylanthranilate isomerase [Myxococcus sp. CA056]NTX38393.1 phosphoribosylanthranilate isomerase [Myxococcus sp. CA033]NTX55362.1 phosphoribosylanthranilate isomerase [Myxococcus sp. CA039A]NTX65365.1 phosphoribosylanthranilate isomerase [Myxococcus sp. CA051A]
MSVRVKVCGVTRLEDARGAWEAGADALGLNFYARSPRCVDVATAAALARTRPPLGAVVGVFVNASPDDIRAKVRECGLTAVQLHGDEPPEACSGYGVPVIKALRVQGPDDVARARTYLRVGDVAGLLLDGAAPGYGGGGVGFDWSLVAGLSGHGVPVLVAGGLKPSNVAEAVRATRPYGVDVASGVESAPGIKDMDAVRAFVRAAKSINLWE